jgi:hypothetical protein
MTAMMGSARGQTDVNVELLEMSRTRARGIVLITAAVLLGACTVGTSPSPSTAPSRSTNVVVTFRVIDQEFRVELTDPKDVEAARRLLRGEEAPRIPNGIVVRGNPGVNTGYSWHIDPASIEFADVTTEVCDGLPSDVEANAITFDRYCPWQAEVIEIAE